MYEDCKPNIQRLISFVIVTIVLEMHARVEDAQRMVHKYKEEGNAIHFCPVLLM